MVNEGAAASGIDTCSEKTTLAILQDDEVNRLQTTMGAAYNSILIVDGAGILQHQILNAQFPPAAEEIETVVNGLLP